MPVCKITYPGSNQRFFQQKLQYCRPNLTVQLMVSIFVCISFIFIIIGGVLIGSSQKLYESYHVCQNNTQCSFQVPIVRIVKNKPLNVYYKLPNYYQNVRTYVQSMNYTQLATISSSQLNDLFSDVQTTTTSKSQVNNLTQTLICTDKNATLIPCSLQWQTMPKIMDFSAKQGSVELPLEVENITWEVDVSDSYLFSSGFAQSTQGRQAIVWLRQSPYESAVKFIGRLNVSGLNLSTNLSLNVRIEVPFSYNMQGNNAEPIPYTTDVGVILSQSGALGGRSETRAAGVMSIVTGVLCGLCGLILIIIWLTNGPRSRLYYADLQQLNAPIKYEVWQGKRWM